MPNNRLIDENLGLPQRKGPRPDTDKRAPHTQLNQLVPPSERQANSLKLVELFANLPDIALAYSRRAPPGSIGMFIADNKARQDERCFLLGTEVAHVHCSDDGSLHAVLPEPVRTQAIKKGWAEPHPFAGQPTVSPDTVMIYAPRNDEEIETVMGLVRVSWANALESQ